MCIRDRTIGNPSLPSLETAFRPFISIKYLIDRIFDGTPFTYTSNFLNTSIATGGSFDFSKLYMDFNWGENEEAEPTTGGSYNGDTSTSTLILSTTSFAAMPLNDESFSTNLGWDNSNDRFVSIYNNTTYTLRRIIKPNTVAAAGTTYTFRWAHYNSAGLLLNVIGLQTETEPQFGPSAPFDYDGDIAILNAGDYLQSDTSAVTRTAVSTSTVPFEQWTEKADIRVRGRSFNFSLTSSDTGVRWRLGTPRVDARADGRR